MWFENVQKTARLCFVALALTVPLEMWKATDQFAGFSRQSAAFVWLVLAAGLGLQLIFWWTFLAFYRQLGRHEGGFHIATRHRIVALAAAIVQGIRLVRDARPQIDHFDPYWQSIHSINWSQGAISALIAAKDAGTFYFAYDLAIILNQVAG